MIENLPNYINILFILTTFLTVFLFYKASGNSSTVLIVIFVWMILQGISGYTNFYVDLKVMPPKFPLLVGPPVLLIIILFLTKKGRTFLDSLDLKTLTYLQVVRVPVEIILFLLYQNGAVPQLMTFEGRNFDILAGLTAPVIAYLGFVKKSISRKMILLWNVICLGLLLNIVINAVLAAPFPFQQFAFEQPNIAVLYFPFVWLPGVIVMIVLISHLDSIRQLVKGNS